MIDLSEGIKPKSDQLNADDLIIGPRTITVTSVRDTGQSEQRFWIHFEGDDGKPWKPCKSMLRVLVKMWGVDGAKYAGRSLTLFCDPTVTFGRDTPGGIRISHMSDIDDDTTIALTVKRGKKAPYQVRKLTVEQKKDAAPTKPRGEIDKARAILETADEATVDAIREPLLAMSWTKEEKIELGALVNSARARKRPAPEVTPEAETEFADEFASA